MADTPAGKLFAGRCMFVAILLTIIFVQLMPLDALPRRWPWPDFMLVATLVWVARRPGFAPFWIIAVIFLLADLLFQRPPGLWAGLIVILTETLRKRTANIRNMPIGLEWGTVAVGIISVTLIYRLVMSVVLLPQTPLGPTLIQMGMTILFYPLVVAVAHLIFGVSRPAPGQVDNLGHRL